MALECLLVTSDSTLLAQIKQIVHTHAASLDLRQDSASAIELAGRRHWDGLVIDCDDGAGGTETLVKVRNSRSNKETVIVAIVNGSTSVETVLDLGANFVLRKPIQEARLRTVLNIALDKMECEHRRYFRYGIDLPVRFRNHLGECFTGKMKNLSEGGLAIKLVDPMHLKGVVPVAFDIPSIEPQTFQGKAEVVWSDAFEMGLRFLYIEKESGIALKSWLSLLEAQCRLREQSESLSSGYAK